MTLSRMIPSKMTSVEWCSAE